MSINVKDQKSVCSLCGYPIDDPFGGRNPWPVADYDTDGPCCSFCDQLVVIPARFRISAKRNSMIADGLDEAEVECRMKDVMEDVMAAAKYDIEEVKFRRRPYRG